MTPAHLVSSTASRLLPYALAVLMWPGAALAGAPDVEVPRFSVLARGDGALPTVLSTLGRPGRDELQLLQLNWAGHQTRIDLRFRSASLVPVEAQDMDEQAVQMPAFDTRYRIAVQAQDRWPLAPGVFAVLGLQLDRDDSEQTRLGPGARLVWQAGAQTIVEARYGRGAAAMRGGIAAYALNGEPQQTLRLEVRQMLAGSWQLRAAAFARDLRDVSLPGIDPDTGMPRDAWFAAAEVRGVEMSAEHAWASGARVRGSTLLQEASGADGAPMSGAPQFSSRLQVKSPLPWAGLNVGYEWVYRQGRQAGDDSGGSEWVATAQSNLSLSSVSLAEGLELSLSVRNLFDMRAAGTDADTVPNEVDANRRSLRLNLGYRF